MTTTITESTVIGTPYGDSLRNERVRVLLNDGSVFDQHIDTGEDFGDEAHGTEPTDWKKVAGQHLAVRRGEADFVFNPETLRVDFVSRGEVKG
jgi:uncharacterized protein YheU (UPF0270 family)